MTDTAPAAIALPRDQIRALRSLRLDSTWSGTTSRIAMDTVLAHVVQEEPLALPAADDGDALEVMAEATHDALYMSAVSWADLSPSLRATRRREAAVALKALHAYAAEKAAR